MMKKTPAVLVQHHMQHKNLHSELCSRTLLAQLGPVYVLLYFYIKKTLEVKSVIQCVGCVVAASPNSLCVRGRDLIPLDRDLNTNLLGRLKTLQLENIKFVDIFGSPNTDCAGFFFIVVQRSMTLTPPLCHSHYCLMRLVCVLICMKFQSLLI